MKKKYLILLPLFFIMVVSCNKKNTSENNNNPFINPSETYLSAPDFDAIKIEHYRPALEEGMSIHAQEINSIANNPEAPTFENTIVALEKSGQLLNRVTSVLYALTSSDTNEELEKVELEMAPKLTAHYNSISLNDKLFQRIKAIYEGNHEGMDEEDVRITKIYFDEFVKEGALLSADQKEVLALINEEIASLTTEFGNKLTKATATPLYFSKDDLEGLGEKELQTASEVAEENGQKGKYAIFLENTTQQPILAQIKNRNTRKKIFEESINRCVKGDENDTREIIKKIALARAKKAELLGYKNFASWNLTDALANNPENVMNMLTKLAKLAKGKITDESKEIELFAQKTEGKDFQLEAWDWNYFAEQLRKEKYGIDEAMVSEYFVVDSVLENGVFYAANKMYQLTFKPRTDIPLYHKDVKTYDVIDKNGEVIALFYFDPYSRPSKSGGAWMSNFVEQSYLLNKKPVIYNVCNNPQPAKGQVALISWDNVTTMFHEFGHALHGIFATQKYPKISGTNVPRDFVEMPSQFNEHAAEDPDVFAHYARHYKTGEVMPKDLYEKMKRAQTFNQAYPLAENLASSLLDMHWHLLSSKDAEKIENIEDFENKILNECGVKFKNIPPRYKSTYFRHIWSNGYAAGYYAYLWTEILCHDIYECMMKKGGLTSDNGQRFRDMIISQGNSKDLMQLFREFTGHQEADIAPLLKARGLK